MLKSDILKELESKQKNLNENDIEQIFNIFTKKIIAALKNKGYSVKPLQEFL